VLLFVIIISSSFPSSVPGLGYQAWKYREMSHNEVGVGECQVLGVNNNSIQLSVYLRAELNSQSPVTESARIVTTAI
jgi:hypothetical protein